MVLRKKYTYRECITQYVSVYSNAMHAIGSEGKRGLTSDECRSVKSRKYLQVELKISFGSCSDTCVIRWSSYTTRLYTELNGALSVRPRFVRTF
jgi:hypothetical protein